MLYLQLLNSLVLALVVYQTLRLDGVGKQVRVEQEETESEGIAGERVPQETLGNERT